MSIISKTIINKLKKEFRLLWRAVPSNTGIKNKFTSQ
jgi:hypothetical protein